MGGDVQSVMKRRRHAHSPSVVHHSPQVGLFWLLVLLSFVGLVWYRTTLQFPVWVDEIGAKFFLFGIPFLVYLLFTKQSVTEFGLASKRFWPGAYLGLALGGIFGFTALFASVLRNGSVLIPYVFTNASFWWAFLLAFATAWWESLFFYGLVLGVLLRLYRGNEWVAAFLTTTIFLVFHAPVLLMKGGGIVLPLTLLALFSFGQSIVYLRYKSLVTMVISHAFWGMALLAYTL